MGYDDTFFSREDRYSIGIERDSRQYYLSIPVSTGVLDYEEYYRLDPDQYKAFLQDKDAAVAFAEACRRHEHPRSAAQYVSDSPEVVVELIRKLAQPPPPLVDDKRVQVGFPGCDREPKYVGSWQWNVHGEARGEEFVKRAAAATLAAIQARSEEE